MLITFSGLDGAGKTTLIRGLRETLEFAGYRVRVLTMYDNIGCYSIIRRLRRSVRVLGKGSVNRFGKILSEDLEYSVTVQGPEKQLDRIDAMTGTVRWLFYRMARSVTVRRVVLFLDLLSLWVYRLFEEGLKRNIVITDRYLYDSLADVAGGRRWHWLFIRLFLLLVPHPDAPVFVDISVERAFERKQEYPIEYMRSRGRVYQSIFGLVPGTIVLVNENLVATLQALEAVVRERMTRKLL